MLELQLLAQVHGGAITGLVCAGLKEYSEAMVALEELRVHQTPRGDLDDNVCVYRRRCGIMLVISLLHHRHRLRAIIERCNINRQVHKGGTGTARLCFLL
jgi:hypothetical protein